MEGINSYKIDFSKVNIRYFLSDDSHCMSDFVLPLEQASHLKKLGLGDSNAHFYWRQCYPLKEGRLLLIDRKERELYESYDYHRDFKFTPTYTFQEIWRILPKDILVDGGYYTLEVYEHDTLQCFDYANHYEHDSYLCRCSENILDAAYDILCDVIEKGFIEKEYLRQDGMEKYTR